MSILDDVRILIGEGLFDEAERRLIEVLNQNPRDPGAISLLSDVERQIYLQKNIQMQFPSRKEALDELERFIARNQIETEFVKKSVTEWLNQLPVNSWIDGVVACGVCGLSEVAEAWIEKKIGETNKIPHLEQIHSWIGQFYFDQNKFSKARQWFERALPLIVDRKNLANQELWKTLRLYQVQCVWQMGDRHQAVQMAIGLKSEFPMDIDVKRVVEQIEKDT